MTSVYVTQNYARYEEAWECVGSSARILAVDTRQGESPASSSPSLVNPRAVLVVVTLPRIEPQSSIPQTVTSRNELV